MESFPNRKEHSFLQQVLLFQGESWFCSMLHVPLSFWAFPVRTGLPGAPAHLSGATHTAAKSCPVYTIDELATVCAYLATYRATINLFISRLSLTCKHWKAKIVLIFSLSLCICQGLNKHSMKEYFSMPWHASCVILGELYGFSVPWFLWNMTTNIIHRRFAAGLNAETWQSVC